MHCYTSSSDVLNIIVIRANYNQNMISSINFSSPIQSSKENLTVNKCNALLSELNNA